MKVIITAAGDGKRWANYMGVRKHLAPIDGERIIDRTIRLLRERGLHDIVVVHHPDHPYEVDAQLSAAPRENHSNTRARLATQHLWADDARTLVILGDTYLSEATVELMLQPYSGWVQFARLSPSRATGKPGPEMVGCQFGPEDREMYARVLTEAGEGTDWPAYCVMTGRPASTPSSEIRDWGHHVEIPDDGTDDFDFSIDYNRWMHHQRPVEKVFTRSQRVMSVDFHKPWMRARRQELAMTHRFYHRKPWELSVIAQIYMQEIGFGGRVLGFGVGREPLPAWFAAHGASVLATDRPEPGVWNDNQHASGFDMIRHEGIFPKELLSSYVVYSPCDMNDIPPTLKDFDFVWSTSCMEHLGGVGAGIAFFANSMKCLRPGGVAVHVTELELGENQMTSPDLCSFKPRDLEGLQQLVRDSGHFMYPLNFSVYPSRPEDRFVAQRPEDDPHLRLSVGGAHTITSIALIARREK